MLRLRRPESRKQCVFCDHRIVPDPGGDNREPFDRELMENEQASREKGI